MILYFNHSYINHPVIKETLQNHSGGSDVLNKLLSLSNYDKAIGSFYNRKGTNFLPTKYKIKNLPGFAMPDYNPEYNKSWSDISDQRCTDLQRNHFDRPWTVMWSGGVDSTVVMTSIIKNLPKADFENITVGCTQMSIWENPRFYFDYIVPNFKIVNADQAMVNAINQKIYMIDGEPADQLFGGLGFSPNLIFQNLELLQTNIVADRSIAVNFIAEKTDNKFAEWYYDTLLQNAISAGIPINTLHDLVWWTGFNQHWAAVKFRFLRYAHWKNIKNAGLFLDRFVQWFDSDDYQLWAMRNQYTGEKLGKTAADYKLAAKKYIYALNQDNYYLTFKTKTASGDVSALSKGVIPPWCCIDHNLDLLNFDNHTDQIIDQLADHFIF